MVSVGGAGSGGALLPTVGARLQAIGFDSMASATFGVAPRRGVALFQTVGNNVLLENATPILTRNIYAWPRTWNGFVEFEKNQPNVNINIVNTQTH
jgi:hypothetical protein